MYDLTYYKLHSITPLSDIRPKDWKYLNLAIQVAEKSNFNSSLRLGACLQVKKQCFLCG